MLGRVLVLLVRAYQLVISPLLPPACRFYPTCSEYMAQAIKSHGAWRGSWFGLRRLLRCHPWHPGGVDLVPSAAQIRSWRKMAAHTDPLHTH